MQEMITRSPRGKLAYRPAHLGNRPDTFVPEDPSVGHHRDIPLQDVQVSAADRGGVHLHDHVSRVNDLRVGHDLPGLLTGPWYTSAFIRPRSAVSAGVGGVLSSRCPVG